MRAWGRTETSVRRADVADCTALSEIHSAAFRRGWSDAEFEALLVQPGVHALLAHVRSAFGHSMAAGFLLYRLVQDEAEILSVAVLDAQRRRGIARMLLEEALRRLYREGGRSVHLEVEATNMPAIKLYREMDFDQTGTRSGYYAQGRSRPAAAIAMSRRLRQAKEEGM